MIQSIVTNVVCPFFGTVAFSIMFNVPRRYYLAGGLTGTAGWLVYKAVVDYTSAGVAAFAGALVVVLISRMLTVKMKCPITVFLISGIFPLVPGVGVYFTAYYLVSGQMARATIQGMEAFKIAFGIVLGIVFIVSIPREVFQEETWEKWKLLRRRNKKIKKEEIEEEHYE